MIVSTRGRWADDLLAGRTPKRFPPDMIRAARRRLDVIEAATALEDLRFPPSNRLEPLRGDRAGQHSIRINDQWRICFRWTARGAEDVEIIDCH